MVVDVKELWQAGKMSLVASVGKQEKLLVVIDGNKPNQLDIDVMRANGISSIGAVSIQDIEEEGIVHKIFADLREKGYKVKEVKYFTSRNVNRSKGEFRSRDFM